ncbi:MAG: hypothetical protein J6T15_00695 [Bacilli bacterium]|nr:hypothetical protein [Bacilli bacterium]
MNKKRSAVFMTLMLVAPLLTGFTESDFIKKTEDFNIDFTDLGEVGDSYKKYKAVITNNTLFPIYPNAFEYQNKKYDFVRANDPIQQPVSIVLGKSSCEFFLIVPKEADVSNYTYQADSFVEVESNGSVKGPYNISYSHENYEDCELVNVGSRSYDLNHEYVYTYLFDVSYDNEHYYSMCCQGRYDSLYLFVTKNTVISELTVNEVTPYRVYKEPEIKRSSSNGSKAFLIALIFIIFMPILILVAFGIIIGVIIYVASKKKKKKQNNSNF